MKILASESWLVAAVMRTQSSSEMRPVRILLSGTCPIEASMRVTSCSEGISMLNIATEARVPGFTAAYSAMLIASVVLPMDGRPAMITRSPARRPAGLGSKSVKPVANPRSLSGLVCHSSIWSMTAAARR